MLHPGTTVVSCATQSHKEAYSSFEDTELDHLLKSLGAKRLFIGGLATEYCVRATVKDGLFFGYQVFVLTDAVRAVSVHPQDGTDAQKEMIRLGAVPVSLSDIGW